MLSKLHPYTHVRKYPPHTFSGCVRRVVSLELDDTFWPARFFHFTSTRYRKKVYVVGTEPSTTVLDKPRNRNNQEKKKKKRKK